MKKTFQTLMVHAAIVLAGMYVVFFFIDKVNSAMAFINNDITKFLLLVLAILTFLNSARLIHFDRVLERNRQKKLRAQRAAQRTRR